MKNINRYSRFIPTAESIVEKGKAEINVGETIDWIVRCIEDLKDS